MPCMNDRVWPAHAAVAPAALCAFAPVNFTRSTSDYSCYWFFRYRTLLGDSGAMTSKKRPSIMRILSCCNED